MAKRFLDDAAKAALQEAVRAIESASSVEVVVAVRTHSGTYAHAEMLAGVIVGWLALGFMLFSPWPFSWPSLLVDPLVVGVLVALASRRLPIVRLGLTRGSARWAAVEQAAAALFVEKGIGRTRDRTGLLVYVSQLERRVCLVADAALERALDGETRRRHAEAVDAAAADGGVAVAVALAALAPALAAALPRRGDDANELPDEVCAP